MLHVSYQFKCSLHMSRIIEHDISRSWFGFVCQIWAIFFYKKIFFFLMGLGNYVNIYISGFNQYVTTG